MPGVRGAAGVPGPRGSGGGIVDGAGESAGRYAMDGLIEAVRTGVGIGYSGGGRGTVAGLEGTATRGQMRHLDPMLASHRRSNS